MESNHFEPSPNQLPFPPLWRTRLLLWLTTQSLSRFGLQRTSHKLKKIGYSEERSTTTNIPNQIKATMIYFKQVKTDATYMGACLSQSLVLQWLLWRQGILTDLRIGVHKRDGFHAHAWVEYDGYPLGEGAAVHQRYHAFQSIINDQESSDV